VAGRERECGDGGGGRGSVGMGVVGEKRDSLTLRLKRLLHKDQDFKHA
jgi:hypothetical protein